MPERTIDAEGIADWIEYQALTGLTRAARSMSSCKTQSMLWKSRSSEHTAQ